LGIQRGGFLQGHRQRRHGHFDRTRQSASDGDNASDDRPKAGEELENIAKAVRFTGYVEISAGARSSQSETAQLFQAIADAGLPCGRYSITGPDDVAAAVRHFFTAEAQAAGQSANAGAAP